jgi:ABC-type amino acid transport system permease subunit
MCRADGGDRLCRDALSADIRLQYGPYVVRPYRIGRASKGFQEIALTSDLRLVVLPQAFRSVIGPLANVLIALTKNTTVAAAIGVAEAAYLMKTMMENEAQTLLIGAVFAFGFVVLTLPTGLILGWLGKRLAVKR